MLLHRVQADRIPEPIEPVIVVAGFEPWHDGFAEKHGLGTTADGRAFYTFRRAQWRVSGGLLRKARHGAALAALVRHDRSDADGLITEALDRSQYGRAAWSEVLGAVPFWVRL